MNPLATYTIARALAADPDAFDGRMVGALSALVDASTWSAALAVAVGQDRVAAERRAAS